jgi:galactokinase
MPVISSFIFGGKGVGSGGDGTAQLLCKSPESREKVNTILTKKGFECMELDLKKRND